MSDREECSKYFIVEKCKKNEENIFVSIPCDHRNLFENTKAFESSTIRGGVENINVAWNVPTTQENIEDLKTLVPLLKIMGIECKWDKEI